MNKKNCCRVCNFPCLFLCCSLSGFIKPFRPNTNTAVTANLCFVFSFPSARREHVASRFIKLLALLFRGPFSADAQLSISSEVHRARVLRAKTGQKEARAKQFGEFNALWMQSRRRRGETSFRFHFFLSLCLR